MATVKGGYYLSDGKTRVPSVTTIIGARKSCGGLMAWAYQCGVDGKDYREERDTAAGIGTIAHKMVECYIRGKPFDANAYEADLVEAARIPFGAFLEWANNSKLEPSRSETALVSERYRFGGTSDVMLVNGKLSLGDYKTSNDIYSDHLMQVAAYGILWEENHPEQPIEGGYHIIRFAKEYGDFSTRWFPELEEAKRGFLLLREVYDIDKNLSKRAK